MGRLARYLTVGLLRHATPQTTEGLHIGDATGGHLFSGLAIDNPLHPVGLAEEYSKAARVSLHADLASAQAALDAGADYDWSALLQPFRHYGEADWLHPSDPGPLFDLDGPVESDGRFAVLTTVGWNHGPSMDIRRPREFGRRADEVLKALPAAAGLEFASDFSFPFPTNGFTFSVWHDFSAMRTFAYRAGVHKPHMEFLRRNDLVDRSSFTRLHIVTERGQL